nr:MAG TPA: hypothetical protein [Caudoviricetes sp.]
MFDINVITLYIFVLQKQIFLYLFSIVKNLTPEVVRNPESVFSFIKNVRKK